MLLIIHNYKFIMKTIAWKLKNIKRSFYLSFFLVTFGSRSTNSIRRIWILEWEIYELSDVIVVLQNLELISFHLLMYSFIQVHTYCLESCKFDMTLRPTLTILLKVVNTRIRKIVQLPIMKYKCTINVFWRFFSPWGKYLTVQSSQIIVLFVDF